MKNSSLIPLLLEYYQLGSEAVLKKGYQWFNQTLSPAIQKASETLSDEEKLLSEVWLITGEVQELLQAPKQAATCYQLAIHFNAYETDNYRWLALVQEQMGQYFEALQNIEEALKYTNEGVALMEDRQRIQDCMVYDKTPDYISDDWLWEFTELLAEGKFQEVIDKVDKSEVKSGELLRCQYRAYGGLQKKKEAKKTWQEIIKLESNSEIGEVDEFYQF